MIIGEILSKAWKIIWTHKVLWFFGVLASCGAARGGGGGGNIGSGDSSSWDKFGNDFGSLPPQLQHFGRQVESAVQDGSIWIYFALIILAVILISLVAGLISFILGTIGRIGVARGAWLADEGEQRLPFGRIWSEIPSHFWRVVLFSILIWVVSLVAGFILILPTLFITIITCGCGLIILIPVLVVFGWLVSGFLELSVVAIVGENRGVIDAIGHTWQMLRQNFWNVLLIAVILSIGGGLAGLIIGLPVILVFLPLVVGLITGGETVMVTAGIISGVLLLVYIPLALLLTGVLYAYLGTAWTLTFRRLTGHNEVLPAA
jgi:hypothetical protein